MKFRISHVFLPYLYVSLAWFVLNRVLVVVFQNGGTFIRNDANSVKEFFKQFFIEKSIRTVVSVVQTANILQEYHINIKSGLRDGVKDEKRHIITRSPACSAPEVLNSIQSSGFANCVGFYCISYPKGNGGVIVSIVQCQS